jgi:hypothetical protein
MARNRAAVEEFKRQLPAAGLLSDDATYINLGMVVLETVDAGLSDWTLKILAAFEMGAVGVRSRGRAAGAGGDGRNPQRRFPLEV